MFDEKKCIFKTPKSNIASIADLPGKIIAVPFGATSYFSLLSALKQQDIDPGQVNILDYATSGYASCMVVRWNRWWLCLATQSIENVRWGWQYCYYLSRAGKGWYYYCWFRDCPQWICGPVPDFLNGYVKALNTVIELYPEDPNASSKAISTEIPYHQKKAWRSWVS